jgi:D-glycero-D-manno-heptose 1,7-bisphosphate phosphatase
VNSSLVRERRAVFLDRDGVLNRVTVRAGLPYPPQSLEEFALYDDVPEGCALLNAAGFILIVITNQPEIGRGQQSLATVEAMHEKLRSILPVLNRIEMCPHAGRSYGNACVCRKPQPGMLQRAAAIVRIKLSESYFIGDRWRDVDCACAAGCRSVFIQRNYAEGLRCQPDFITASFSSAVDAILRDAQSQPRLATAV